MSAPRIAAFATAGDQSGDAARIATLLELVGPELWAFAHNNRFGSGVRTLKRAARERPDLIVMEGTGSVGGAAVVLARLLFGVPYIVSSGDAVGPYIGMRAPLLGWVGTLYERLLCRWSAGFIGWTPYLAGRALTFGAPRAMTAANWAEPAPAKPNRSSVRTAAGIPEDAIVFGIVGSLAWSGTRQYAYGLELVAARRQASNPRVHVLIVGDGSGRAQLESAAAGGPEVHFVGRVERDEVPSYLAAMDVASLPQSVDGVGAFRYTTKLSEYIAARLPVITGEIPMAYDLDTGWIWRLPGDAPWDGEYIGALTELMDEITEDRIAEKRSRLPEALDVFDREAQQERVAAFVLDAVRRTQAKRR